MNYKTLVVDDEPLARRRIQSLLKADPEIQVIGAFGNGREAAQAIRELKPDLVFLDIQMPEMDGFQVLCDVAGVHMPTVLFVTAFDQYAIRAFEAHALDYLLKPVKRARFFGALDHAKQQVRLRQENHYEQRIADLMKHNAPAPARLVLRSGGKLVFVHPDEIEWIEAAANYVRLHARAEVHTVREKISAIERELDPKSFLRVHRSIIVNLDKVKEVVPCGSGEYVVLMKNGRELSFGRSYRDRLEHFLAKIGGARRAANHAGLIAMDVGQ
ncbi:MAG TPA: LytTR family transcriptional regulator DNA-binding domain-containing protein [Terriglobales bacterium]|jgi:two-component system LytT family response regulator